MKTKIISRVSLCLLSIFILSNSYSQKIALKASFSNTRWQTDAGNLSSLGDFTGDEKVNKRVSAYFGKNFKNAENISWEEADENLIATFKRGGITTKSLFNKNGRLVYTIDFFPEEMLPNSVEKMAKRNYRKYVIISSSKISEANRQIWVIKLESKKDFATVRIEDGEMEEVENFQKQN